MELSDSNYLKVRRWLREKCGVELGDARKTMVCSRLFRRMLKLKLESVDHYIDSLEKLPSSHKEWTYFIDVLTTHETYFYREATHFDFLNQIGFKNLQSNPVKILSAACSTGEETYTLAIEADLFFRDKSQWKIFGTDISLQSVLSAMRGHFPDTRAKLIPQHKLKEYFLKGVDEHEGTCLVKKSLREKVQFFASNILEPIPHAPFDIIFCRNVLIYFDVDTKKQAITNLTKMLNPGGYLFVSQTEQLRGLTNDSWLVTPSILRVPL